MTYDELPDEKKQLLKRELRKLFLTDFGFDDKELGRAVVTLDQSARAEFARKYRLKDADEVNKALAQISGNRRVPKYAKRIDRFFVVTNPTKKDEYGDFVFLADSIELGDIVVGTGASEWRRSRPAFYDTGMDAEADANKRLDKLWDGEIPEWVYANRSAGNSTGKRAAFWNRQKPTGPTAPEGPVVKWFNRFAEVNEAFIEKLQQKARKVFKRAPGGFSLPTQDDEDAFFFKPLHDLEGWFRVLFPAGYGSDFLDLARNLGVEVVRSHGMIASDLNRWAVKKAMSRVSGVQYARIGDAADTTGNPKYKGTSAEIWYVLPAYHRHFGMGSGYAETQYGLAPTVETLVDTHVKLGTIGERDLEALFEMMQGEVWSPEGEARSLILKSGAKHTSMSVGDVAVVAGQAYMVEPAGFKKLKG